MSNDAKVFFLTCLHIVGVLATICMFTFCTILMFDIDTPLVYNIGTFIMTLTSLTWLVTGTAIILKDK